MSNNLDFIDLTIPMDNNLEIYLDEKYSDPEFKIEEHCNIKFQGYKVSKITMGTQTGTHIDAPSHFKDGAMTLDELPVSNLIGQYMFVSLDMLDIADLASQFNNEKILFLSSLKQVSSLSLEQLEALGSLDIKIWIITGDILIEGKDDLYFHRYLAENNIFLIENLNKDMCKYVKAAGRVIALPLHLVGTSGSPCRVVVESSEQ